MERKIRKQVFMGYKAYIFRDGSEIACEEYGSNLNTRKVMSLVKKKYGRGCAVGINRIYGIYEMDESFFLKNAVLINSVIK